MMTKCRSSIVLTMHFILPALGLLVGRTWSQAVVNSCLKGLTTSLPNDTARVKYEPFDVDVRRVLYPELMFTCSGVLTGAEILFMTTQGLRWDNILDLQVVIMRRESHGGYVSSNQLNFMQTVTTSPSTTQQVSGTARLVLLPRAIIRIQRYDFITFNIPARSSQLGQSVREHIPYLLRDDPDSCIIPGCRIPVMAVKFTSSERPTVSVGSAGTRATVQQTVATPEPSPNERTENCTTRASGMTVTVTEPLTRIGESGEGQPALIALGVALAFMIAIVILLLVVIIVLVVRMRKSKNNLKDPVKSIDTPVEYEVVTEHRLQKLNGRPVSEPDSIIYYEYTDTALLEMNLQLYESIQPDNGVTTSNASIGSATVDYSNVEYWEPGQTEEDLYKQMTQRKYNLVPLNDIEMQLEPLGEGEFGVVYKGQWTSTEGRTRTIAMKTLKATASKDERVKLLQEAAIMGQFRHPHIVKLYGVAKELQMSALVMEYFGGGELKVYLRTISERVRTSPQDPWKDSLERTLLQFCQEIADGMRYLSRKGFIHRDLAARNILLTEDYRCKIADFGMCRDLEEDYYYKQKGGRIPLKWTAPEAIFYKKYTCKSDVWSYGMVMYEIWSLGHVPFENFALEEVLKVIKSKRVLPPPPGCPRGIYTIMVECWHPEHKRRPSFASMYSRLHSNSDTICEWNPRPEAPNFPLCTVLGGPIEHGQDLHRDLQDTYK